MRASAPWVQLTVTDDDWDAAEPALLVTMFSQLALIRAFEENVLELAGAGLIHGPAHSSIGQEGGAVGSALALTDADTVNGSHRGHHQFLAKTLNHVAPGGLDPARPYPDEVRGPAAAAAWPRSAAWTAASAMAGVARCTCSGARPGRWAPTPSSAAASRRPPGSPGISCTRARTR